MGLGAISCTQRHHLSAPNTPKTGAAWGHANVRPRFRSTILAVEVLRSALRHDVEPEDIQHVVRNALVVEEIAEILFGICFSALIAPEDSLSWS